MLGRKIATHIDSLEIITAKIKQDYKMALRYLDIRWEKEGIDKDKSLYLRKMKSQILPTVLLSTSYNLLVSIQEKIKWADSMSEIDKKHINEVDERVEEVKNSLSAKNGPARAVVSSIVEWLMPHVHECYSSCHLWLNQLARVGAKSPETGLHICSMIFLLSFSTQTTNFIHTICWSIIHSLYLELF